MSFTLLSSIHFLKTPPLSDELLELGRVSRLRPNTIVEGRWVGLWGGGGGGPRLVGVGKDARGPKVSHSQLEALTLTECLELKAQLKFEAVPQAGDLSSWLKGRAQTPAGGPRARVPSTLPKVLNPPLSRQEANPFNPKYG
ncbi:UNVERIFIED_CONTAM: hypothetical protein Sradi_3600200 [Sesamum radiatum]|uniref:Uncharacterized protein n=1 Tax=Sesamum radiatum TaxID=300843 RepID=A0AAW2QGV4_SESRA